MTIEQMIEVMQAYKEGKKIQCKPKAGNLWCDEVDPLWNFFVSDYRVKPDSKYRPYKDTEEMIADWKKRFNKTTATYSMPLIWVTNHKVNSVITDYAKYAVMVSGTFQSLETLYEECIYLDGSPCGKKETE